MKTVLRFMIRLALLFLFLNVWWTADGNSAELVPTTANRVHFFALGDQGTGDQRQKQVARAMEQVATGSHGVDFVLLLGDNFYPDGVNSTTDPQWSTAFEAIYQGKWLAQTPFLAILGNHDHRGSVAAQIAYGQRRLGSGRWRMQARQEWMDLGSTSAGQPLLRLVLLDAELPIAMQADFLRQSLAQGTPLWRVVATHVPLDSSGRHGSQAERLEKLLPVMQEMQIDLHLAGHDHHQELIRQPGKPVQVISGAGGRALYRVGQRLPGSRFTSAGQHGFVHLELTSTQLVITFYDDQARRLHQEQVRRSGP
ncbi:MAG: acid phosphatase [Magnetococcales bacterium]|nr:metallophosphoesterase [Magnetococcales bacterium]NGZ04984.1 acid phosphatase [Magnetococcales bacterium]